MHACNLLVSSSYPQSTSHIHVTSHSSSPPSSSSLRPFWITRKLKRDSLRSADSPEAFKWVHSLTPAGRGEEEEDDEDEVKEENGVVLHISKKRGRQSKVDVRQRKDEATGRYEIAGYVDGKCSWVGSYKTAAE